MACCGDDDDKSHDANKGKGPLENRSCTDIIFLALFIAFWIGMFIIAGFAFANGNWRRLVYGADSYGNICGINNAQKIFSNNSGLDLTGYNYLYYTDPSSKTGLKICVRSCPAVPSSSNGNTGVLVCNVNDCTTNNSDVCMGNTGNPYRVITTAVSPYTNTTSADKGDADGCPTIVYNSYALPGLRRCVPVDASSYVDALYSNMDNETFQEIFSDFYNAALIILYSALIACAISLVVIFLMRCCAAVLIYTMVLAAQGALIALCVFLIVQWQKLKNARTDLDAEDKNEKVFKGLSIAAIIITVIVFLILVAMRNRIRLTVAIFEEASTCLARMPQISISPVFAYICLGAFFAYWFFVYLYLASAKSLTTDSNGHAAYTVTDSYTKMWWYHLFGLFWTSQFILACQEIVLAGAVATWYFTREKSSISSPYTSSIYRLIRYHIGSAAFGSLIIAIIQMARFVLGYIQKKLKGKTSKIVEFILCCLQCCLWCFEKFMKFINKNAYIEIAVYGYSFCRAAMTAFILLAKNILRVIAINTIGAFTLFMCKILIVCVTCAIALGMLRANEDLHYYGLVLLVIGVFSFYIADTFIGVYKMAIDTIFLSFLEDSETNNGKDKPYFMSDNLLKFMKSGAQNTFAEEPKKDSGKDAEKSKPPGYTQPPVYN